MSAHYPRIPVNKIDMCQITHIFFCVPEELVTVDGAARGRELIYVGRWLY
jgi:hypothetical protein